LPAVRHDAKAGERDLDVMGWGLVPFWAKDIKVGFSNINAMAEAVDSKPAFREAFQRRRCLVPVDSFYEMGGDRYEMGGDRGRQAAPRTDAVQCPTPREVLVGLPDFHIAVKALRDKWCGQAFRVGRESGLIPVTDA
jgi:hypothetical protein